MRKRVAGFVLTAAVVLSTPLAFASDIGQEIADQIDVVSYQYYLDDELYTHYGHSRGISGAEHNLARDNIVEIFEGFGLQVELDEFEYWGQPGWNVVATQVGTVYADVQYILGAHYDSVDNPGADDDASGVAGLLEIARVLSQYETEYTIKYIAFDMEELGLIGSQIYVDDHLDDDIRGMIQSDMIAWDYGLYSAEILGRSASLPLKNALAAAINEYGAGLNVVVSGQSDGSDHAPFEWAGFQACQLAERYRRSNPHYHTQLDSVDTPDYISYGLAADCVRSLAGFLADYAGVIVGPCVGDVDADGDTDQADLGILLADWGCTSYCLGDLDGDDDTDQSDLAILLADWGCTP